MNERDIFIEALQKPSLGQRRQFLDQVCGDDQTLRLGVEALLAAHDRAGSFLQEPVLAAGSEESASISMAEWATVALPPDGSDRSANSDTLGEEIPDKAGPIVPGYEILSELGRGGMGVVYKARQLSLNRLVALKMVLAGSHAGVFDLVRFHAEAEAVAQLQHPNIVQVHEIGKAGGLPFLSLEFVSGGSLAQKMAGVPQLPRDAAALVEILARAVHHAHEHGIIHRDLKPANVLIDAAGAPRITDFGLAKRSGTGSGMTETGQILGTPSYMAPEQALGKKDVGAACDVYALGAILYEMLTGRPPFRAAAPLDTMVQVVSDEPISPRRLQPKLPCDLETICLKCLRKEPHKRYGSAQELADDLARFREDRPIVARPTSTLEHAWRWCRRSPVVAALLALVVVGVTVAGVLLARERSRTFANLNRAEEAEDKLTGQLQRAEEAERERTKQLRRAEEAERERTEQLWQSYRDQAEARRFSRQVGQRFESIKALAKAARIARSLGKGDDVFHDLRRKAIACLALPDLRLEKDLPGWSPDTRSVVIDDSFERYALRDKQGSISVRRVANGQEIRLLPGTRPAGSPGPFTFSPNGRYLAAAHALGRRLEVSDLDRKKVVVTSPSVDDGLGFSPDSRRVAFFARKTGEFVVCDLTTGRVKMRWKGPVGGCNGLVFHPDGQQFAEFNRRNQTIRFWAADSGRLLGELPQPGRIQSIDWNRDGSLLATTVIGTPLIRIWNVSARKQVGLLEGHKNFGVSSFFDPAHDLLVSSGWESMLRLWNPRTGKQLLSLPGFNGEKFNRAGDRILLLGKVQQLWKIADGREYRTFVSESNRGAQEPYDFSISPDGRMVAAGMRDGTRLWDMASGRELGFLPTGQSFQALFQPTGDLLTCAYHGGGLMRWPIRPDPDRPGGLRIGPPETLVAGGISRVAQSKDGRTVAAVINNGTVAVLTRDQAGKAKLRLVPSPFAAYLGLSPDGRWVAIGTHRARGIKIWSVLDNKLERELPANSAAIPVFSPDGLWLYTTCEAERRLWKVGSWAPGPSLPERSGRFTEDERAAFSPDGRWLALAENSPATTIVDTKTGRPAATLDDPNQDRPYGVAFSPDGGQLVLSTWDSYSIHVWDLRRIRAQLKAIGLDWNAPPYRAPAPAAPLEVRVVGADPDNS